jgi:hypothetical protein
MTLQSTAQELFVVDQEAAMGPLGDHGMQIIPLEVADFGHDHDHDHPDMAEPELVVNPEPVEILVTLGPESLGIDNPDPMPIVEEPELVVEEKEKDKDKAEDVDPAQAAKNEKWDWAKRGPKGFIAWVKERCDDVPKHSGYDTAGLERAVAYLERLDGEVSKAMRSDIDGELDANQIEKVRAIIDNGIERLQDRLDKVKQSKKKPKKKKANESYDGLVKEAQKITGVQGVFVTVDLLTSHIARVCINGMVSAGHDIEDMFERQASYFNLNKRERAQVIQLLDDMGYSMRRDRGYMPDDDVDAASSDNFDWQANYNSNSNTWGKDR